MNWNMILQKQILNKKILFYVSTSKRLPCDVHYDFQYESKKNNILEIQIKTAKMLGWA